MIPSNVIHTPLQRILLLSSFSSYQNGPLDLIIGDLSVVIVVLILS